MPNDSTSSPFAFLSSKPVIAVTVLLLIEIAIFYGSSTKEFIPSPPRLDTLALEVGPWHSEKQWATDAETQRILRADDSLNRIYTGPGEVELFIAFFKSQRAGVVPHSPKECLPGNGWIQESAEIVNIKVPGELEPIPINQYVVSLGERRQMVMYWYQSPHRVTADEYLSKVHLVLDSLRYHRSDEALVRVITSANPGAQGKATQFIQDIYQPLKKQMWDHTDSASAQTPLFGLHQ